MGDSARVQKRTRRDGRGLIVALVVVLFAIPSRDVFAGSGLAITPAVALSFLILALWVGGRLMPGAHPPISKNPVAIALGIYLLTVVLSAAGAGSMFHSPDEARGLDRGIITMIAVLGSAVVLTDVLTVSGVKRIVTVMCWCATGLSLVGIVQFEFGVNVSNFLLHIPGLRSTFSQNFILTRSIFRRPSGTAEHPIEFGVVLASVLPLAAYRAFGAKTRVQAQWRWISAVVILVGAAMSLSRGAFIAIAVAGIVMVTTWKGRRIANVAIAGALVFASLRVAIPGLVGTMISLFLHLSSDPSIKGRTQDYAIVGGTIKDHPLIGRGFGTFIPGPNDLLDNQYLGTIVETGFVGLAGLLLVFIVAFMCARGARRVCGPDRDTAELAQALAGSVAGCAVYFATFDALSFPMARGVTFVLVGCAGALWMQTRRYKTDPLMAELEAGHEEKALVTQGAR
jgi:O-antigen ligase